MIKILSDDRIPFVSELYSELGELILKPGAAICKNDLRDVNALLIRSITPVNADLLNNTAVEFVASATAGFNHIDHHWLEKKGITWAYAPGANAIAVAEYVLHCVAFLQKKNLLPPNKVTAAVVGVGHVGSIVSERLKKIGFIVLHNDPPRASLEKNFISTPLASLTHADLICLHAPLTKTGKFPTYHLIDKHFLAKLKPGCVLLNAGRGAVIDTTALLKQDKIITCLDVWENEPHINLALLEKVTIGTPHVAGYTQSAKLRATLMIYEAFLKYFQLPKTHQFEELQQLQKKVIVDIKDCHTVEDVLLKIYDPGKETQIMRNALAENPDQFETLRRHYQLRHEFSAIQLTPPPSPTLKKRLSPWGWPMP